LKQKFNHLVGHWINGELQIGKGMRSNIFNPSTGAVIREVTLANPTEVSSTIAYAQAALPGWMETPALRRARIMFKFRELLEAAQDRIAECIALEHGKTVADASGEITRGLEVLEFACGAPHLLKGEFSLNVGTGVDGFDFRQPLGVIAGVTPFNFPVMVPMWMFPLALVCGNTFILKPSERVPSASLLLAELLHSAGLPKGVFNVLQGDSHTVDALIKDPGVAAISFVGSTNVAKHIYTQGTAQGKRVQALGGAKNHMVVMPDAELDGVTEALVGAAFGSAGERCMAISVAVVVTDVLADALIKSLKTRIMSLKIGASDATNIDMGPLINLAHKTRVIEYVASGIAEGAQLIIDGRETTIPGYENGFFLGPCLFDHVKENMLIYREEIFGPVLCIIRVPDLNHAIKLINTHEYGNGTAIFTQNGATARHFIEKIEVGMVGINIPLPVPMAFHSFGGWKNSMFGDHHAYGMEGIRFYSRLKAVSQRWPEKHSMHADFVMPTL